MLTVAIPKRNKLQNIIVLTPKDGSVCPSDTDIRFPPAFFLHVLFSDRSPAHNLSAFQ